MGDGNCVPGTAGNRKCRVVENGKTSNTQKAGELIHLD